jgi:hypothetical protein
LLLATNTTHDYMANPPPPAPPRARLEAVGFCGADDSVNPRLLKLISKNYPLVEWGVLFRPDREGQPRYATEGWVSRLSRIVLDDDDNDEGGGRGETGRRRNSGGVVRLAAHLCGSHVNDLLGSSIDPECARRIDAFVRKLGGWGFRRIQVNATAVNGVDTGRLLTSSGGDTDSAAATSFLRTAAAHPDLEFIVQRNDETEPLWSALLLPLPPPLPERHTLPDNVVFLHDESKGTGTSVPGGVWPADARFVSSNTSRAVGYAGGIRPSNVVSAMEGASLACSSSGGGRFWIDMESGVRTTVFNKDDDDDDDDGTRREVDIFDLAKCYDCIDGLCEAGWMDHPPGLR